MKRYIVYFEAVDAQTVEADSREEAERNAVPPDSEYHWTVLEIEEE